MAHGGKREGAGRPKGARNAATKDQVASISELAREHTDTALATLAQIATTGESEAARVSAANALLDRGYGKPTQAMDHTSSDGTMTPKPAIDASKLSKSTLEELAELADGTDDES